MLHATLKPLVVAAGVATGLLFAGSDAKAQAIVPVGHHGHHYGHYQNRGYHHQGYSHYRPYYGGYRYYARPYYAGPVYRPGGLSFSVTPGYGLGLGYSSGGYYSPYGAFGFGSFASPWGW